MAKKAAPAKTGTTCPVTKAQFLASAKPLAVNIDGQIKSADVKEFSSGSFGFFLGDKVTLNIGGTPVKCQVTCSIVAVGSKPSA